MDSPTDEQICEYTELSIRNNRCFAELECFNKKGEFKGEHPIVMKDVEREEIKELLLKTPDVFLKESRLLDKNISRYQGYLRSDKYSESQKVSYQVILQKHQRRKKLFEEVLKQSIYGGSKI